MEKQQNLSSRGEPHLSDPVREAMLRFSAQVLNKRGYATQPLTGQAGLLIMDELELTASPAMETNELFGVELQLCFKHAIAFPDGISISLLGQGLSPEEQALSISRQFVGQIFYTVYDALDAVPQHQEKIHSTAAGQTIDWHVFRSEVLSQGNWEGLGEAQYLYGVVGDQLPSKLEDRPFNWAMLSLIRDDEQGTRGSCSWNNADWPEGYQLLHDYFSQLPQTGRRIAQQEFVVFRRCGKH